MYQEIKSRRLALLVAIALTGGSLAGATNAYAAEVTGQNVTIDASNRPSNNATDPYGNTGSAAGAINDPANGDDVSGNTLTLENYDYSGKNIFGGFTRGTGRAKNNTVDIRSGGKVDAAYGGITYGGDVVGNRVYLRAGGLVDGVVGGYVRGASGSAEDNHVVVESGTVNDFIRGGNIDDPAFTGHVTGNTVTIAGGVIDAPVYGGYTNGSGNVTGNRVTITGGEIHGSVIGGDTFGSGNVTGNTVTITGGEIRDHVYGGFTYGNGDVTGNIVNIGDGAHDLAAGTRIDKSIYGGSNRGGSGTISGNILHVKASASAQNIHNFDTINFHFTNTLSPKLTLSDAAGTTIKSLKGISVNGLPKNMSGTLIENRSGTITVTDGTSSVTKTGDTAETILSTDTTRKKIDYTRYIFKGARTAESSISHETWGGRSVIGNTTTGNEITVTSGTHNVVYGGWTRDDASSQTATADKGNSTYNKVTVDGTETVSEDVYGGMTTVADGKASHNEVTINKGVTLSSGDVYGGSAADGSSVDDNKVYLNGIDTPGNVYGGSTGLGTANGNEVHLNGATVTESVFGGDGGSTNKNKVYLLNGAQVTGSVYGGNATSANDNEVHLNGATVTGPVYGGAANGTGNLLSVKGVNRAGKIAGFQKVTFDATGVAAGQRMLTITDTANRTALDWNTLTATGTARDIDLIYHAQGIDLSNYTAGSVKSALSEDGKSEYDIEAVREGGTVKRIAYNSYQFKDARTAESSTYHETWGGRSVIGNTTTDNVITVSSGTHADVYGGWTRGASSQTATADKGNSTDNKVTVDGTATVSGNVYGGMTTVADGKASHNEVTINKGVTLSSGDVYGGSAADGSSVDDNKVYLNGIDTPGNVYGGSTGLGTANGNEVHLNGATVTRFVYGGSGASASKNKVYLNGAQVTGDVYGGNAASADDNEVHLNGARVTGDVYGGAADGTGNTLNVAGTNSARQIAGFQRVNFDATGVAAGAPMLNLNGGAGTTLDRGAIDATGSTVNGGITLLHNANGITVNGLGATDNILKSETDATTEKNIAVHRTGGNITDIRYEGYQFAGVTTPVIDGGEAFGGISKAGNSTHDNAITVNGDYTNVYGGHTSGAGTTRDDKNNSYRNSVTITGGTLGNVYGGYTAAADGTTNNNTVTLAGGTVTGTVSGGNRTALGNTLNVNTAARVGRIENFEKVAFKDAASKLTLTDTGTFNLDTLATNFEATANPVTLVESANALSLAGGKAFKSELNADGTQETDLDVRGGKKIVRYAYTFAGAKAATTVGSDTWGGRSAAGNTTTGNEITLAGGSYTNVYGGRTTGAGSTAAADKRGNSISNKVTVNGTAAVSGIVYGGYTDVTGGRATDNVVTIEKASVGSVVGGYGTTASGNVINLTDATVSGSVTGGRGTITNDNIIHLRNTKVTGTVTGGSGTITNENRTGFRSVTVSSTAASGTGNTLAVYYGTDTTSIGDLGGIQNIRFDLEDAPTDGTAHTMLNLTNVSGGNKTLSDMNIGFYRTGAAKKLEQGDTFTLVENTTAGGSVSIGDNVKAEGKDGSSRSYTFNITKNADGKLVATVSKMGVDEQNKSYVETRTGASAFLNSGADFLAGTGTDAAKKEAAAAATTPGAAPFGLWAGMGGGSLRHETGSYVEMKGWNLGVGWARENAVKAGTLTFGPFIEYGRGSYDSYLDDGTHGSGKTSYLGAGMMVKLETKANTWIDGSLRVGRTKSDYTGRDNSYDMTSTYYAMHVSVGKDFRVREGDTVSAYVRYAYAHTAGASAHLSKGETYDFDAVNSHRLRIGTRYTHGGTALSQIYAGLAWEYEFDGDARATYQGDSTPSPSLKGGSALLELGYRFAPKADSRVSYDLSLSGWQGKRQGVTGGISVKWAF